jgi:L-amino acid N-acyltransferase YncA
MNFLIREAQPGDAEGIVNILNPIIEVGLYTVLDTPFSIEEERRFIADFPDSGVFLVAVNPTDGAIVGFQNAEPFASYTHAFDHVACMSTYISLAYRRRGVARQLFQESFRHGRAKGLEKIFTFVRADNPGALAAYRSQGFSVIGTARRHAKVRGKYVDEILIEKFL